MDYCINSVKLYKIKIMQKREKENNKRRIKRIIKQR